MSVRFQEHSISRDFSCNFFVHQSRFHQSRFHQSRFHVQIEEESWMSGNLERRNSMSIFASWARPPNQMNWVLSELRWRWLADIQGSSAMVVLKTFTTSNAAASAGL